MWRSDNHLRLLCPAVESTRGGCTLRLEYSLGPAATSLHPGNTTPTSLVIHIYVAESLITIVFFCQLHSSENCIYRPNNATSKYKLILRFITVNYIGICIIVGRTDSHSFTLYSVYTSTITTVLAVCVCDPDLRMFGGQLLFVLTILPYMIE